MINELIQRLNVSAYVNLINHLGVNLDGRIERFEKSQIIERSLEKYTEGYLTYVDQVGYDFISEDGDLVEFKYQKNCLFTPKGNKRSRVQSIKLKNTLGSKGNKDSLIADYYLFSQQNCMAIIERERLLNNIKIVNDGIWGNPPLSDMEFIFYPSSIKLIEIDFDYGKRKRKIQDKIIEIFETL